MKPSPAENPGKLPLLLEPLQPCLRVLLGELQILLSAPVNWEEEDLEVVLL